MLHPSDRQRSVRGLFVLSLLAVSLVLRGESCVTEDRSVEGVISVRLETPWTSQGYTDNDDAGNLGEYADGIIDALNDVSTDEIRAALDAGAKVTIAGASGRVTSNSGHDAARMVSVSVTAPILKATESLLEMAIPNNQTGTSVTASTDEPDRYLHLQGDGVTLLANALTGFLRFYVDGNEQLARLSLENIQWEATWQSNPEPSAQSPDNFQWQAELIVNIPVLFELTVPNL